MNQQVVASLLVDFRSTTLVRLNEITKNPHTSQVLLDHHNKTLDKLNEVLKDFGYESVDLEWHRVNVLKQSKGDEVTC